MRLASGIKAKTKADEVAAYALNRLSPMYATTRRGYLQQQKLAFTDRTVSDWKYYLDPTRST